jgi:hypothetical protein
MSDRTKELIVERVLALRPWRNPAYVLGHLLRRWVLTLWVATLCLALILPYPLSAALVGAAIAFDVTRTPRAFDLALSSREFIAALAERRPLGSYGRTQFRRFLLRTGLLVVAIPSVLAGVASLVALVASPAIAEFAVSAFMLAAGASLAVAVADASAEGVHSSLGGLEDKAPDYLVSIVLPRDNLHFEDLFPRRWWINLQHFAVTLAAMPGIALFGVGIWALNVEPIGKPLLAIGLALSSYMLLYLAPAALIFGFWLYRGRLLLQCIKDVQRAYQP